MNLKNFSLLFSTIAFLGACQNSDNVETLTEHPVVSIVANIGNPVPVSSRYVHDESTDNASFTVKDKIGVFMNNNSVVQWEFDGSSWSTNNTMYWGNRIDKHKFYAFCPYADTVKDQIPMPSLLEQDGTSGNLARHDFLVATTEQAYSDNNGQVDLTFSHISSLLKLKLANTGDLKNAAIDKITIRRTGLLTSKIYSFDDNKLTPDDTSIDELVWEPKDGLAMTGEVVCLYFIVNSSSDNDLNETATLTIEYTHAEKHYIAQRTDFPLSPVSGSKHVFNIKINGNQQIIISGKTILPWEGSNDGEDIVINGEENDNQV